MTCDCVEEHDYGSPSQGGQNAGGTCAYVLPSNQALDLSSCAALLSSDDGEIVIEDTVEMNVWFLCTACLTCHLP